MGEEREKRMKGKTMERGRRGREGRWRWRSMKTRPDTRLIPVADGWAGAKMRVFTLSNSITMTDGPTDRRTDGQSLLESLVRD